MQVYDLYIVNPVVRDCARLEVPFDIAHLGRRGLVELASPLKDLRSFFSTIRRAGANVYFVPVEYRTPRVSIESARAIAQEERVRRMRASGRRLEELDVGSDDLLWWSFRADDNDAIARGMVPGAVWFSIDKLDGHVRTADELEEWLGLHAEELG